MAGRSEWHARWPARPGDGERRPARSRQGGGPVGAATVSRQPGRVPPTGAWARLATGVARVWAAREGRYAFGAGAPVFAAAYGMLLPFAYTQRISPANWRYLDPRTAAFSLLFGLLLGWMAALQVYALRRGVGGAGRGTGALAALVGLVPSMLCCTPIVPLLLGLGGVSGIAAYSIGGPIQGFFALHETDFLLAGALLLLASAAWGTRAVSSGCCRGEACGESRRQEARAG